MLYPYTSKYESAHQILIVIALLSMGKCGKTLAKNETTSPAVYISMGVSRRFLGICDKYILPKSHELASTILDLF